MANTVAPPPQQGSRHTEGEEIEKDAMWMITWIYRVYHRPHFPSILAYNTTTTTATQRGLISELLFDLSQTTGRAAAIQQLNILLKATWSI